MKKILLSVGILLSCVVMQASFLTEKEVYEDIAKPFVVSTSVLGLNHLIDYSTFAMTSDPTNICAGAVKVATGYGIKKVGEYAENEMIKIVEAVAKEKKRWSNELENKKYQDIARPVHRAIIEQAARIGKDLTESRNNSNIKLAIKEYAKWIDKCLSKNGNFNVKMNQFKLAEESRLNSSCVHKLLAAASVVKLIGQTLLTCGVYNLAFNSVSNSMLQKVCPTAISSLASRAYNFIPSWIRSDSSMDLEADTRSFKEHIAAETLNKIIKPAAFIALSKMPLLTVIAGDAKEIVYLKRSCPILIPYYISKFVLLRMNFDMLFKQSNIITRSSSLQFLMQRLSKIKKQWDDAGKKAKLEEEEEEEDLS